MNKVLHHRMSLVSIIFVSRGFILDAGLKSYVSSLIYSYNIIDTSLSFLKVSFFFSILNLMLSIVLIWLSTISNSFWVFLFVFACFVMFLKVNINTLKDNSSKHLFSFVQFQFRRSKKLDKTI